MFRNIGILMCYIMVFILRYLRISSDRRCGPMADYYTEKARSEYSREHSEYHDESGSNSWSEEDTGYSKAEQIKRWIIGIVIVAVVLAILALALKIFVVFLLPVILIIFVVKLIMDYFDR